MMAAIYGKRKCASRGGARKRGKGGVCRHFHVHYHFPGRAYFLSFFPSSSSFSWSMISCLLLPTILFFAVIALIVLFVWFTLVYFVAFLFTKDSNHVCFTYNGVNLAADVDSQCKGGAEQEEEEEKEVSLRSFHVNHQASLVAKDELEQVGDFAGGETFTKRQEKGDVVAYQFSDDVDQEAHDSYDKVPEQAIVEPDGEGLSNSFTDLDDFAEGHEVEEEPADGFGEELHVREISKVYGKLPEVHDFDDQGEDIGGLSLDFVDGKPDEEFIKNNRQEESGNSFEIFDYETREMAHDDSAYKDETRVVASLDEDERHPEKRISEGGAPSRMPLLPRSSSPWWNFCGVVDVFLGSKN